MNENWLEIVSMLRPHFDRDSTEDLYQEGVERCLQILGWKRFNNSMQVQYSLPIGNNNFMRIDILLGKNGINVLPIEIKRPSNVCNSRQESQLLSYMRQLRLNVGLYIGEEIRVYYDNPEDSLDAICVFSSKIEDSNVNGEKLCNLLYYSNFDKEVFESFCKDEYDKIQTKMNIQSRISEFLSPEHYQKNIQSLIRQKFIDEGFDGSSIDDILKDIEISVNNVSTMTKTTIFTESKIISYSQSGTEKRYSRIYPNERRTYTRIAPQSNLSVIFADGTIISDKKAIEVERQFIIRVGMERVRSLGITHCHENLIGTPSTTHNPEKYGNRWTPLDKGLYLFNCTNNQDKKKHIEKIIKAFSIKAKVKLEV